MLNEVVQVVRELAGTLRVVVFLDLLFELSLDDLPPEKVYQPGDYVLAHLVLLSQNVGFFAHLGQVDLLDVLVSLHLGEHTFKHFLSLLQNVDVAQGNLVQILQFLLEVPNHQGLCFDFLVLLFYYLVDQIDLLLQLFIPLYSLMRLCLEGFELLAGLQVLLFVVGALVLVELQVFFQGTVQVLQRLNFVQILHFLLLVLVFFHPPLRGLVLELFFQTQVFGLQNIQLRVQSDLDVQGVFHLYVFEDWLFVSLDLNYVVQDLKGILELGNSAAQLAIHFSKGLAQVRSFQLPFPLHRGIQRNAAELHGLGLLSRVHELGKLVPVFDHFLVDFVQLHFLVVSGGKFGQFLEK